MGVVFNQPSGHVVAPLMRFDHADQVATVTCTHADDTQRAIQSEIETFAQLLFHGQQTVLVGVLLIGPLRPTVPRA